MRTILKSTIASALRNRSFGNFSSYMLASMVNKALPFLLLPLLTTYLTPAEYGTVALFQVALTFTVALVGMNMQTNITRRYFRDDQEELAKLIFTLLGLLFGLSALVLAVLAVVIYFYPSLFDLPAGWVYSLPIVAAMMMLNQFNLTMLRNRGRALLYGTFEVANMGINLVVTIVLVVGYGWGWQGRAMGIAVAPFVVGLLGLLRLYRMRYIRPNWDRNRVRQILNVSVPLIPHALSMIVISLSDRLFLDRMLGKEAVGVYTVGYQFGMIVAISTDSFNKVWSPWMYRNLAHINSRLRTRIVQVTYLYDIGVIVFAVCVTYLSYGLIRLMTTEAYYAARQFVIWVAIGYAVRGMYTMRFPYLVQVGKTGFLAIMSTVAAVVNLIANYILIARFGAVGAAQATLLAFIIQFVGVWWYANRIHPMPWRNPAIVSAWKDLKLFSSKLDREP